MPVIDLSFHYMKWDHFQGLYIDILKHTHMRSIIGKIILLLLLLLLLLLQS